MKYIAMIFLALALSALSSFISYHEIIQSDWAWWFFGAVCGMAVLGLGEILK
jgi:hypothetical protein